MFRETLEVSPGLFLGFSVWCIYEMGESMSGTPRGCGRGGACRKHETKTLFCSKLNYLRKFPLLPIP